MKALYEVKTRYNSSKGTIRNCHSLRVVARNLKEAVAKANQELRKNQYGATFVDEVIFISEIDL